MNILQLDLEDSKETSFSKFLYFALIQGFSVPSYLNDEIKEFLQVFAYISYMRFLQTHIFQILINCNTTVPKIIQYSWIASQIILIPIDLYSLLPDLTPALEIKFPLSLLTAHQLRRLSYHFADLQRKSLNQY